MHREHPGAAGRRRGHGPGRAGLILRAEPDIEVVGEASDGLEAVTAAADLRPDVVLIDVHMPGLDGLSVTREILSAGSATNVIVLTTFNDESYVRRALRLGASGFLLKVAPPERLVEGIRIVARGDGLLDPLVTRRVIEAFAAVAEPEPRDAEPGHAEPAPGTDFLTARELEVLHMLARGMSNGEIATALVVGEATGKTHVARVLMKLHLRDRVQAVVFAYEHGLVRPETR